MTSVLDATRVALPRFQFKPRPVEEFQFRPAASSLQDLSRELVITGPRAIFSATLDIMLAVAGGTAVGYAVYTILKFASAL